MCNVYIEHQAIAAGATATTTSTHTTLHRSMVRTSTRISISIFPALYIELHSIVIIHLSTSNKGQTFL